MESTSSDSTEVYFRIFDLPPELRLMVWAFALFPNRNSEVAPIFRDNPDNYEEPIPRHPRPLYRYPPLLQTSQQLRNEASEAYFKRVEFHLRDKELFDRRLLHLLGSLDQHLVRSIFVHFRYIRTLRGQLYCLERFMAWLDDHIPRHGFEPGMLNVEIPIDWKGGSDNHSEMASLEKLRSIFEDPLAKQRGEGRGVDLKPWMGEMLWIDEVDRWTNA